MLELFQAAPKPFPIICGNVIEGAKGFDVRRCRRRALEETEDLPKFGLLDKWEKYDPEKEYDFYYVDAGPLTDVFFQLPYRGPGIYWKVAWRELEEEVREKTEWATVASEHIKGDVLKSAFAEIERCVRSSYVLEPEEKAEAQVKLAILGIIGLWGKTYQYSWRVTKALNEDDRLGSIFKTSRTDDGRLELYTRVETLQNITMMPVHLIALNMEHVYLARAAKAIITNGYRVIGMQVDCAYYSGKQGIERQNALEDEFRTMVHPSGDLIFRKTFAKAPLNCALKDHKVQCLASPWRSEEAEEAEPDPDNEVKTSFGNWVEGPVLKRTWRCFTEENYFEERATTHRDKNVMRAMRLAGWPDIDETRKTLALKIFKTGGCCLQGPPGTGKTLLARAVAHHTDCQFIRVSGSELV